MATFTYTGSFSSAGQGVDGLTVNAWKASRFTAAPALDGSPPSGSPDATTISGIETGFDGSYAIALPTSETYYISLVDGPHTYWQGPIFQMFEDGVAQGGAAAAGTINPAVIGPTTTATTQSPGDNTTKLATTAFVTAAIGSPGSVTTVSVVSANGLAGTVATATTTPAITLSTTITGILKGNGTAISAASAGTDYLAPTGSGSGLSGIPTSVSNTDGFATVTPTTGAVVVSRPASTTVSVTSNAGTVPVTAARAIFTNSSAATMAITLATSGATSEQPLIVVIYDFSAAAETIGWTNTENSTVSVPTTSNGSTTLPLTVGFLFNSQTTKWRCVAVV